MQHAIERVERPGESQEALDGKKIVGARSAPRTPVPGPCAGSATGLSTVPNKYTQARQPVTLRLCLIALVSEHSGCFRWKNSGKTMPPCKIDR